MEIIIDGDTLNTGLRG